MKRIITIFGAVLFVAFFMVGCGQDSAKLKELELKEKELALKEKQFALDSAANANQNKPITTENNNTKNQPTTNNEVSSVEPDYSNLSEFWRDFKDAALKQDYRKVTEMTAFPFFYQNSTMTKTEFKSFTFSEYVLPEIKTAKQPIKSAFWINNYKSGSLYEVNCGGPALYFSKIEGEWRFVGFMFGE